MTQKTEADPFFNRDLTKFTPQEIYASSKEDCPLGVVWNIRKPNGKSNLQRSAYLYRPDGTMYAYGMEGDSSFYRVEYRLVNEVWLTIVGEITRAQTEQGGRYTLTPDQQPHVYLPALEKDSYVPLRVVLEGSNAGPIPVPVGPYYHIDYGPYQSGELHRPKKTELHVNGTQKTPVYSADLRHIEEASLPPIIYTPGNSRAIDTALQGIFTKMV